MNRKFQLLYLIEQYFLGNYDTYPMLGRGDRWSSADVQCTPLRVTKSNHRKQRDNPDRISVRVSFCFVW